MITAIIATIVIAFATFIELISGGTFIIFIMVTTSATALLITIITISEVLFPGNPLDDYIYKGLSVLFYFSVILTAIFL
ncbi:MAG: hypothetical protein K9M12_02300 [Candidatus Pacebacteria bacterium]|nr:hypothetical protein [Candidatus Paceibacterota bacterium]